MRKGFEQLKVWQQARVLAGEIYQLTESFPAKEQYCLVQQMRRAAVSIMSNIAEGQGRFSRKDFRHFLFVARGSLMELQSCLILSLDLGYLERPGVADCYRRCNEVARMLNGLIASFNIERKTGLMHKPS
jgi:four helix bundle protein